MSARCDLEGHNILTLNLANDIAMGKTDAKRARAWQERGGHAQARDEDQGHAGRERARRQDACKGAGDLAMLIPLDGERFATAFMAAMIKGHSDVLAMIDGKLLTTAKNDAVKSHLTATRAHVAMHLEEAKKIQAGLAGAQAKR